VLHIIVIIVIIFLLTYAWTSYYKRLRGQNRRLMRTQPSLDRRFHKRITADPEEQYIEGIGIIIGDISCTYNARSPYISCAVNPDGLCQNCHHYQRQDE
jgi:hypothetical protein